MSLNMFSLSISRKHTQQSLAGLRIMLASSESCFSELWAPVLLAAGSKVVTELPEAPPGE